MQRDYGFDKPDVRHIFFLKDGGQVHIQIYRSWFFNEDLDNGAGGSDYKVEWIIREGERVIFHLKENDEEKAIKLVKLLYKGKIKKKATEKDFEEDTSSVGLTTLTEDGTGFERWG